jgi:hypothetical protein
MATPAMVSGAHGEGRKQHDNDVQWKSLYGAGIGSQLTGSSIPCGASCHRSYAFEESWHREEAVGAGDRGSRRQS